MSRLRGRVGDFPARHLPIDFLQLVQGKLGLRLAEIERWLEQKPVDGDWFIRGEFATCGAGAVRVHIPGYKIEDGKLGVLHFLANACGLSTDYPNVVFELDVDNAAVPGFASIIGPLTPSIYDPFPVMVGLTPGQIVMVVASNQGPKAIANVQAPGLGWGWTITVEERESCSPYAIEAAATF